MTAWVKKPQEFSAGQWNGDWAAFQASFPGSLSGVVKYDGPDASICLGIPALLGQPPLHFRVLNLTDWLVRGWYGTSEDPRNSQVLTDGQFQFEFAEYGDVYVTP